MGPLPSFGRTLGLMVILSILDLEGFMSWLRIADVMRNKAKCGLYGSIT